MNVSGRVVHREGETDVKLESGMWMVYSINLKKKNEDTVGREREMEE